MRRSSSGHEPPSTTVSPGLLRTASTSWSSGNPAAQTYPTKCPHRCYAPVRYPQRVSPGAELARVFGRANKGRGSAATEHPQRVSPGAELARVFGRANKGRGSAATEHFAGTPRKLGPSVRNRNTKVRRRPTTPPTPHEPRSSSRSTLSSGVPSTLSSGVPLPTWRTAPTLTLVLTPVDSAAKLHMSLAVLAPGEPHKLRAASSARIRANPSRPSTTSAVPSRIPPTRRSTTSSQAPPMTASSGRQLPSTLSRS
jgi:hypothetical protein